MEKEEITIKDIRMKLGYTQSQMAELLGISRPYYSLKETYKRPIKATELVAICSKARVNPMRVKVA